MKSNISHAFKMTGFLLLTAAGLGCASIHPVWNSAIINKTVKESRAENLDLVIPFDLDDPIREEIEREIGTISTPPTRLKEIIQFLNNRGYLGFQYERDESITAVEAFHSRTGNCMAFTNLYIGIARHLGLDAYFIHVTEAGSYYERNGTFVASSHMAIGYGDSPPITVVDFNRRTDSLREYTRIDDLTAFCLFYNNVAVDHMLVGEVDEAEKLLSFLLKKQPALKELRNNYGVLFLRRGMAEKALQIFDELIEDEPQYTPAYTNALVSARALGLDKRVKEISASADQNTSHDPFFLFQRAVQHFQNDDMDSAAELFKRALKFQPSSAAIHYWYARTLFRAGRERKGLTHFEKAIELEPSHPLYYTITREFPNLAAARSS